MMMLDFAKNKNYYLLGLGKSNRSAFNALKKAGARLYLWDDNPEMRAGYDEALLCPPEGAPWECLEAVVSAPGILPSHKAIVKAVEKNIPVICDIDLFMQAEPKTKIIGVTGTNGKSTVTALICHILKGSGTAQMGGNIGTPVLDLIGEADYTVLELSSYQLERSPHLKCDVAVLLNISKDHLDWHETMDNYIAAKERIFANAEHKIISVDDDYCKDIFDRQDEATPITVFADGLPFKQSDMPKLKGLHNLQNMLAAYAACRSLGLEHEQVLGRMKTFEGLAHRQYLVRIINGIPYINDSKATNAEASRAALRSFRNILWLAGGKPKDGGLQAVEGEFGNVTHAYLYGEAAEDFYKFLDARGIPADIFKTLEDALRTAHKRAQDSRGEPTGAPTVLLSPACASFDQFKNFEERGDHFAALVGRLSDE